MAIPLWAIMAGVNALSSGLGASSANKERDRQVKEKSTAYKWLGYGGDPGSIKVQDSQSVLGSALGGAATGAGIGMLMPAGVENAWQVLMKNPEALAAAKLKESTAAAAAKTAADLAAKGASRAPSGIPGVAPGANIMPAQARGSLLSDILPYETVAEKYYGR